MRIGHGYDVHKLVKNRKLILGGVSIDYKKGLLGHSDADVLLHAIMDSLLGAAGLNDIGCHFPDSDNRYKNISSVELLKHTVVLLKRKNFVINNIDATIIAEKPKLKDYIPQMRTIIANNCMISSEKVNIKATTEEGLGFTGKRKGIAAHAVCTIE